MMELQRGQIVRSLAGHDKGGLFCVVGTEGDFLLLADGKGRPIAAPKRKRRKHAQSAGMWTHPVLERIQKAEPVRDSEIRRALAAFRDEWSRR